MLGHTSFPAISYAVIKNLFSLRAHHPIISSWYSHQNGLLIRYVIDFISESPSHTGHLYVIEPCPNVWIF